MSPENWGHNLEYYLNQHHRPTASKSLRGKIEVRTQFIPSHQISSPSNPLTSFGEILSLSHASGLRRASPRARTSLESF